MNENRRRVGICAAVAATVGLAAVSATNAEAVEPAVRGVVVRFAHLDLGSEAGVAALYAGLRRAARRACRPVDSYQLALRLAWRRCTDEALADAVARIANERLSALHAMRREGSAPRGVAVGAASAANFH